MDSINLSEMLKKREIEKVEEDKEAAERLLAAGERMLKTANDNLGIENYDVALSLAYNAMLNAGMSLMAAKGYRAFSEGHHKTVVTFCAIFLGSSASLLVNIFNRCRVRRHEVVYGEIAGSAVEKSEAENAVAKAKEFVELIKSKR
ncbi:MAG: HEPN domain-containing protein [Candidatus Micrarchaeota archaeon]